MATMTVTELAEVLGTDGRTTRKFLRSITPKESQPGKGSRWEIEKKSVRSLKSQYAKYAAEVATKGAVKADPDETPDEG